MPKPSKQTLTKTFLAGALGNTIEWYDFAIYGYFTLVFSKLFFPHEDQFVSIISTFSIFAIGFLMRPIGGIIYGHIGDKIGRKKALIISVVTITLCTALMGCLPTYATAGDLAVVLLIILRLIQGLSAGGEAGGAYIYVLEFTPYKKHGVIGASLMCMIVLGTLLGSLVATLFTSTMSDTTLYAWGWRVPFLISIILGVVILILRLGIKETPEFMQLQKQNKLEKIPLAKVFQSYKCAALQTVGIVALGASSFYFIFVFLPMQIASALNVSLHDILWVNTLNMIVVMIGLPLFGLWSDHIGRKPLLISGSLIFIIFSLPLLWLMSVTSLTVDAILQLLFGIFVAFYEGPVIASIFTLAPASIRYSAIALSYNISFAVFGGLGPVIATALYKWQHAFALPGLYLVIAALVSLITAFTLPNNPPKKTGRP